MCRMLGVSRRQPEVYGFFLSSFGPATSYSILLDIRFFLLGCYQVCNCSGETLVKLDRRKGKA